MTSLFLRDVEVDARVVDVRCAEGRVDAIGRGLRPAPDQVVIEGRGAALLPGLHDHHIHLVAAAAAARSVAAGPPAVRSIEALREALHDADATLPPGAWIRAVGYHESVAGHIDRHDLDQLVPQRPVRLQHRSGTLWVLNTRACQAVTGREPSHPMELDEHGEVTGRLFREDEWLRARVPPDEGPELTALGRRLAGYGVTGVTDATPTDDPSSFALLAEGVLPQRVHVTGGVASARAAFPAPLSAGPVKVMVHESELPTLEALAQTILTAHRAARPVALHLVDRSALVLALSAWTEAGSIRGDRIEHGSIIPLQLTETIARMGLTVVTQPNFVAERGDEYLRQVEPDDLPDLYRCRSLLAAGIRVGAGTDAPFGSPDPWKGIAGAIDRRAPSGAAVGADEAVTPEVALGLYLSALDDPGGPRRRVQVGEPADLVLLHLPLTAALHEPRAESVRMTIVGGDIVPSD